MFMQWEGSTTQISMGGHGPPSNQAKWHVYPSNGLSRVHDCDRRRGLSTMDKIVCMQEAISPHNRKQQHQE